MGAEIQEIPMIEEIEPLDLKDEILPWEHDYIDSLNSVDNKEIESIYGSRNEIATGVIGISCGYMKRAIESIEIMGFYLEEFAPILISSEKGDIFELLFNLQIYAAQHGAKQDDIKKLMKMLYKFISQSGLYDKSLIKERWTEYDSHDFAATAANFDEAKMMKQAEFTQTFEHICEFAEVDEEKQPSTKRSLMHILLFLIERVRRITSVRFVRKPLIYSMKFIKRPSLELWNLKPMAVSLILLLRCF
ncbi:hypothetical protein CIY_03480 [Butyrivibrio fibrisolvens 16/4]|nr:hypothetical protein CIY_03480 [Butyrivibrio fibrisolvens 16/4]